MVLLQGYTDVIQVLLKFRADLLAEDRNGSTPLVLARKKKHRDVVTLLELLIEQRGESFEAWDIAQWETWLAVFFILSFADSVLPNHAELSSQCSILINVF